MWMPVGCGSLPPRFQFQSMRLFHFLLLFFFFFLFFPFLPLRQSTQLLFASSCSVSLSACSGIQITALHSSQRWPQQCPALLKSNKIGKEGREQENLWPGVDSTAHCQWVLRDLCDLCVRLEMHFLCICHSKTHLLARRKPLITRWCWSSLGKEVLLTVANSLCSCLMET